MATPLPRNRAFLADATVVAQLVGGTVVQPGEGQVDWRSVCTDSREVERGDVFVALAGEKHDAHAFVRDVVARGAGVLIVSRDVAVPAAVGVVRVADTLVALGALAARQRKTSSAKVIALTGSVGKTTTKEMCAAVLRERFPDVVATVGNLNNLVGVPRTLLMLEEETSYAVVEMGMNVPGEIAKLAAIARPGIAIVTNVAPVHTEGVGSIQGVAREKGSLLTSLEENAIAIYDADEPLLAPYVEASRARTKLGFGLHVDAAVRLVSRTTTATGQTVVYSVEGESDVRVVDLALLGAGAAKNAAAAIAMSTCTGSTTEATRRGLESLRPEPGRLCPIAGPGGTVIVDDSYNASPRSVINAIDTATEIARSTSGRLVVVLGDMLELGALETELHALVGEHVALAGVSLFVACGKRMRAAADEAREMGADLVLEVDDPMDAVREVERFLIEGDVVVIKGSRGMRMERVVEALKSREEAAE